MRMTRALLVAVPFIVATAFIACSSDDTPAATPTNDAGGVEGGGDDGATAVTLDTPSVACADTADSIYGDPGALSPDPAARGKVIKCAKDGDLTKEAMTGKLVTYEGKPLVSDARVYKISYRTERGDTANTPSVSSAIVYIPKTPRAAKIPVVVAARGSRGQAAKCAVTKFDPSLDGINADAYDMVYPLVGSGYAVIVPDLAGYANFGAVGNPPSAYAQAADVAKSTLDGTRALKSLFPALDNKVVIVGHSQGGHTALSALAMGESYGASDPIVAVAVFAPLWLSQRSWGALLYQPVGQDYALAKVPAAGNVSVWYHYTQGELLDGPGQGKSVFKADKQAAIEEFVKNDCWGSTKLSTLGATYINELYDPSFVSDVSFIAATGAPCDTERCTKWVARYSADRPHLTGKAATTPIFVAYGLKDETLVPNRMKCAFDRLQEDKVTATVCVEAEKGHGSIVSARADYAADWIANVALGAPAPPACAANETALTEACKAPPPND